MYNCRIWDVEQWMCWGSVNGKKMPSDIYGNISGSTRTEDYVAFQTAYEATKARPQLGLAFCFTKFDQFVGIDIDDCIDVKTGRLMEWAVPIHERFSHCYQEVSPSRAGIKIYCQGSLERFGTSRIAIETGAVEIYEHGRFFAVTLTRCGLVDHYDTPLAQDALDWLLKVHFPAKKEPIAVSAGSVQRVDESNVVNRVFGVALDESHLGRNNACFSMACQFRDNGIAESKSLELARLYSDQTTRSDNPFTHDEAERCVRSVYRRESREPWTSSIDLPQIPNLVADDFHVTSEVPSIATAAKDDLRTIDTLGEFPLDELISHSPLIRDFIEYYRTSAIYYQPQMGLAAALTLISTMVSRRVISDLGSTANLYCVSVAPTGAGKESPRALIKDILERTGQIDLLGGEKFASGVAIARALQSNPVQLFLIDEFGLALRSAGAMNAGSHLREIVEMLLTTFSSSDKLWIGKIYADERNNIRIQRPHAVLYATTTPDELWNGITRESVTNGLLGRVMLFEGAYVRRTRAKRERRLTTNLLEWVDAWGQFLPGGDVSDTSSGNPQMRVIEHDDDALERSISHQEAIAERRTSEDPAMAAIWSRCGEKAGRLALCLAASRCVPRQQFKIRIEDVNMAIKLANFTTRRMCAVVLEDIASSDFDRDCQRVLKTIRRRMEDGKATDRSIIHRNLKIRSRDADEIIRTLISQGEVAIDGLSGEFRLLRF